MDIPSCMSKIVKICENIYPESAEQRKNFVWGKNVTVLVRGKIANHCWFKKRFDLFEIFC